MSDESIVLARVVEPSPERKSFRLPALPYGYADLEPVMSETTLRTHHRMHHARYVEMTNRILESRMLDVEIGSCGCLEDVIRDAVHRRAEQLFNNAAQAWNHGFFWESMTPDPSRPKGRLADAIKLDFGDMDSLRTRFLSAGGSHFGSGWVWLIAQGPNLSVVTTHDAATPLTDEGTTPLLACDLWEHAYYLDHRQDRAAFLSAWWARLANWDFAARQYGAALGDGHGWHYPAAI